MIPYLRSKFLPPESPQELILRTLYHRLQAMPFFIRRQEKLARASYHNWSAGQVLQPVPVDFNTQPTISFLLSISSVDQKSVNRTINSLLELLLPGWQVFLIDEREKQTILPRELFTDERVHQPLAISELPIVMESFEPDEFVVFCRAGDVFDRSLLNHFYHQLEKAPSADVYYYDNEYQAVEGESKSFFKPVAVSPELLLSTNYLSRSFLRWSVIKSFTDLFSAVEGLLAWEYALMLKLMSEGVGMEHIPRVLVTQSPLTKTENSAVKRAIQQHYELQGQRKVKVTDDEGKRRVNWATGHPTVSLIILSHNHAGWLKLFIDSIFSLTEYPDYSITVVDNRSSDKDLLDYYEELASEQRVSVVHYDEEFNYSKAINIGVAHSSGEIIVLLNNDMRVIDPAWLGELVQWAAHSQIGVVGAKLLHRKRSIQHAGIILGMNGFIGHLYLNAPEHYHGLAGSVDWYRNYYAVTGACQALRRELFEKVGGYDERFRLAFGDIDFCLRVVSEGYRNLYNPFARLIHFEGGSRGYETPVNDILLGYDELHPWLEKDDPYFSPNLTYTPIPRANDHPDAVSERLVKIENRKQALVSGLQKTNTN